MHGYLDRHEVERQFKIEDWQRILLNDFATTLLSEERLFPCIFGVAGYRANQLRFYFADPLDIKELAATLESYLKEARSIGQNTSLIVMTKPGPVHGMPYYRMKFWSILKDLSEYDPMPWPQDIPEHLDMPGWEFCFAGEPIFLVCNTPAHVLRQSRRSTSFMMTFQPRWVFENILGTDQSAANAFQKVRTRLAAYDFLPASPDLGRYGDLKTREFAQYFLDEQNKSAICPFHSLITSKERVA